MPINTVLNVVLGVLSNLPLPGQGGSTLVAVIDPPDPEASALLPHAYIWPSDGDERRETLPRPLQGTPGTGTTQAGWKQKQHNVSVWVTWFRDQDDPGRDVSFPIIMDAIEDALRCTTDPVRVQDPATFRWSQVFSVGEELRYAIDIPRTVKDQRTLRYDGKIDIIAKEEFQA